MSWICPRCETENNGDCEVCGYRNTTQVNEHEYNKLKNKLSALTKTLKTKDLRIGELESRLKNKNSKGLAIAFPWLISVVLGIIIISYLGSFNQYKEEANKVPGLNHEINNLETKLNQSVFEVRSLQNTISSINSMIDNIVFNTGLDYRNSNSSSFDKNWRLFFTTYASINLKKVKVCAKENGKIRILLYDINENLVSRSNEFILNRGGNHWYTLKVNIPISKGSYFLTFEGNTSLKYDSNNLKYPYTIDDIIKITGSDSKLNKNKTSYYQYFYNWEFSLKTD